MVISQETIQGVCKDLRLSSYIHGCILPVTWIELKVLSKSGEQIPYSRDWEKEGIRRRAPQCVATEEAKNPADCCLGRAEGAARNTLSSPPSPSCPPAHSSCYGERVFCKAKNGVLFTPLPQLMQELPLLASLAPPFYPLASHW